MASEDETIWITSEEPLQESEERRSSGDTGGGFSSAAASSLISKLQKKKRVPLDAQALHSQLQVLMKVVSNLFVQSEAERGLYLDEVTISVEINAEGQVSLVGSSNVQRSTGGITMKFTRPPESEKRF